MIYSLPLTRLDFNAKSLLQKTFYMKQVSTGKSCSQDLSIMPYLIKAF